MSGNGADEAAEHAGPAEADLHHVHEGDADRRPRQGPPPVLEVDIERRVFTAADGTVLDAVRDLHFTLPANSFTCIVGPSGCGKTTTLRMILGLDRDFSGRVHRRDDALVAAVFQEPRLLPWRTVEQNVRLALPRAAASSHRETPGRNSSRSRLDAPGADTPGTEGDVGHDLDALFFSLGLDEHRGFFPAELSLGLARRVALARAFALRPGLLVLDEPFVSLDEATADRLRALLLDQWRARPTTALMVTHNAREASLLADRILVFSARPARLVDTIVLDTAREHRTESDIQRVVARLSPIVDETD